MGDFDSGVTFVFREGNLKESSDEYLKFSLRYQVGKRALALLYRQS